MDIDIIELADRKAKFVLSDVSPAFINGLRRGILAEVPVMAIDEINIYENSSVLFDEEFALRLGLIPLKMKTNSYVLPGECNCHGEGCSLCRVSLTISAEGPRIVYSSDLVSMDPSLEPADKTIPIVELKDKQKIVVEAIARLGIGRKHSKWQAGIAAGYKNVPEIKIRKCEYCGKCIEACPRKILKLEENNIRTVNILECSMCKLCEDICDMNAIKISDKKDSFLMTYETTGAFTATDIAIETMKNIKKRAQELSEIVEALQ